MRLTVTIIILLNVFLFMGEVQAETDLTLKQSLETCQDPDKPTCARDVQREHLYQELRVQWGQYVHKNPHQVLEADITCDGIKDQIIGWLDLDNPDGIQYRIMTVYEVLPDPQSTTVSFAVGGNSQMGLCTANGASPPEISLETYSQLEADNATGMGKSCTTAIRVDDGMCDAPRLFWIKDKQSFAVSRN